MRANLSTLSMTLLDTLKVYKAISYEDHAETTTTHPEHNNVDEFIAEIINSDNKSQRYRNVYYSNYNNNNDNDGNHNDGNWTATVTTVTITTTTILATTTTAPL